MTLLESWKDSLQLLRLQSLKELAAASWQTMKDVFRALCAPWFLILVIVVFLIGSLSGQPYRVGRAFGGFLLTIAFVAALPVSQVKNFKYFLTYLGRYYWGSIKFMVLLFSLIVMLFITFVIIFAVIAATPVPVVVTKVFVGLAGLLLVASIVALIFIGVIGSFVLLFYMMRPITIRAAIKKALVFILYNAPLFLLINVLVGLLLIPAYMFDMLSSNIVRLIALPLIFVTVCLAINIYTRRVNAQPMLY